MNLSDGDAHRREGTGGGRRVTRTAGSRDARPSASREAVGPRRTKIVCTLGPASWTSSVIASLIGAGMDCARLNFSHGTPAEHLGAMRRVRLAAEKAGKVVAVMQDLPGPKMRVGELEGGSLELRAGSKVVLTTRARAKDAIPVGSEDLPRYVRAGGRVFLSDGSIVLRVTATTETTVECVCEVGGLLLSGKGVNIPDLKRGFNAFTETDRRFLEFGLAHGVDIVAVSFVRRASDIRAVRRFAEERRASPLIVAKIEKREAVENVSEIADVSDAVMVARGDLGVENPIEEVPEMQKSIIATCRSKGVPVITATQMLESMVRNASPTRAEVTDVANAIIDGTDAVMLSEETAVGKHPVACVEIMNRVALRAEEMMLDGGRGLPGFNALDLSDALSQSAWQLSEQIQAAVIAVRTGEETIIPKISRFRPGALVVHISEREERLRRSKIVWGVYQCPGEDGVGPEAPLDSSVRSLTERGFLKEGDMGVFVRDVSLSPKHGRFSLSALTVGRPSR